MEFLTTIYGFGSVLAVCVMVVVLAMLGFKVKATRDGITAARESLGKPEPQMPEKYARITVQLVEAAVDHMKRMCEFWPRCLESQMAVYEEQERGVLVRLMQECSDCLDHYKLSVEMHDSELARWRAEIKNAFVDVKDHVRSVFRNNHYYEMSSEEWERYTENKVKAIALIVSDHLDTFWRSAVVPRNALRSIGEERKEEFARVVRDVFNRARIISIRTREKETEEVARYASQMSLVTGLEYPVGCV